MNPVHIRLFDAVRDPARLQALRRLGLLDSPSEPAFDRLVRLASRMLDVPVALVSLVDAERQFFASCIGLPEPWASARETPLSYSFCQHAVASGQPLIINDARAHPLVQASLAVSDLDVIAYAGIPLKLTTGEIPGVLCVISHAPRVWTEDDVATLQDLAASVMTELELRAELHKFRQVEAALRASEERYRNLVELCPDPILMHSDGMIEYVNQASVSFFGAASPEALCGQPISSIVDPDYYDHLAERMQQVYNGVAVPFMEQRLVRRDGQPRYADVAAVPIQYNDKSAAQVFIRDLTMHKQAEAAIRAHEAILSSFYNSASMLMGVVETLDDDIVHHSDNAATARLFGVSVEAMRNQRASQLGLSHDVIAMWLQHYRASAQANQPMRFEYQHHSDCGIRWFAATVCPINSAPAERPLFSYVVEDVTEQKAVALALAASEQRFRMLATHAPVGIFETDLRGNLLFANERYGALVGIPSNQIRGSGWARALHPDDFDRVLTQWRASTQHGSEMSLEARFQHPSGALVWVYGRAVPIRGADGSMQGYIGTITDITAHKHAEQQIKASLAEKEVLLKEIHHRVKNNLQVISSLLTLQAEAITDPGMREVFIESQRRVRSMALVHEKLYQSADLVQIDFATYVQSLTTYLLRVYRVGTQIIHVRTTVADVQLDIDRALSFGLILSELVSNSLKHAFADRAHGEIRISLARDARRNLVLTIADTGVGLPPDFDLDASASMGLQVVAAFVTQLHGSMTSTNAMGAVFTIVVPERTVAHA